MRFIFVNAPEPHSTKGVSSFIFSYKRHLVELTAAASFSVFFASLSDFSNFFALSWSDFFLLVRNSSSHTFGNLFPLSLLHLLQAIARLSILFVPPLLFGYICSTSRGIFSAPQ